ncbi:MAG TPA: chemotaxis protein CheB [Acetobacteraceae bacterium]
MMDEADSSGLQSDAEAAERETVGTACPIVGVGASAGGVDALRRLFPNVQSDCGMAFVVVQHLDPARQSALAEVLARSSALPVVQIENETEVEPNHVYVIPPNASLTIQNGRLLLSTPFGPRGHPSSIDEFFTSLARHQGENAACVILSGTGSDGTVGLRAIKEGGGLTLAQAEAEYDGMMRSAVATGLVDFVLGVEDIPGTLADYFDHVSRTSNQRREGAVRPDTADRIWQITDLLRSQTGHDFSGYKDRTIVRRVQRRMHVLQIDNISQFIERLGRDSREVNLLFQDLLIGVTNFFRDPDAFAALEHEVVPQLFAGKGPDDAVRVWVPGCATGEEAYSIAILLREFAPKLGAAPKLQVFATDIDDHALDIARIGRFPPTISNDISSSRLERYFLREDGTYRIAGDLREICLFSTHNLLRDAPFSKLDLISCRNLLIYLGGDLQGRIIPLFHYALVPNGFLFLGTSENVTRHSRLFSTIDKVHRIFRQRNHLDRRVPEFPLTAPDAARRVTRAPKLRVPAPEPSLKVAAERQLLDRFAPAYVVVNSDGDVLQSSGRTGKYLELPSGPPETNIFSMARPGLRLEVRAALHRATDSGQLAVQTKVSIDTDGGLQPIDLYVQPLRFGTPLETTYMIVLQDLGPATPLDEAEVLRGGDVEGAGVHHLEAELRATRERLQTMTEELESSNEELKSSNEELQSINEELQSSNEELETSKEELQSVNEELQTVNAELNARVEELSRANNDMSNLLESTQIATVFLDRKLMVKGFTPAAKDVFRLVESDAGRPIMHVRPRFESSGLQEDAERVLRTLGTIERPVRSNENDTRYIMRMLPYRNADDVIGGVVMTFTDITRISAAEARIEELAGDLRARIDDLETTLDLIPVGVMITGSGNDILINSYGARLMGIEARQKGLHPVTNAFRLLTDGNEMPKQEHPLIRAARSGETVSNWQGRLENGRGKGVYVMISASPLFAENGDVRGAVAAIVDISPHKQAEAQQQFLLSELQHRVKNTLATINALALRMLRTRPSVDEFCEGFLARLAAMGRTHDLLASGAWSGASVRSLIEAALEPYINRNHDNILLSGGAVGLRANAAATLGMVLHELATNASKYGALSLPGGTVDVSWALSDADSVDTRRLRVTWIERGGPPVTPPSDSGFGSAFIRRSVEYELGGAATLDFAPGGLECILDFPLTGGLEPPTPEEDV